MGPGHAAWLGLANPVALVLLALALTLPRLTTPDAYVFDELYYAYTAGRYVAGEESYNTEVMPRDDPAIEWTHPPLAKLLIAGGILVGGDNPLGWRIASVLAGVAGVLITYGLALTLTGSRVTSAVAAGLLLLDGLYLVESRTGMSNLFQLVFSNGALLALTRVLAAPPERAGPPLLATGAFLGLAIATKWSAVALAGLIGLVVCWRIVRLWRETRTGVRATGLSDLGARRADCRTRRNLRRVLSALLSDRARLGRFRAVASGHAGLSPRAGNGPRRFFALVAVAAGGAGGLVLRGSAARGAGRGLRQWQPASLLADGGGRALGGHRLVGAPPGRVADPAARLFRPVAALGALPARHVHLPSPAGRAAGVRGPGGGGQRRLARWWSTAPGKVAGWRGGPRRRTW